MRAWFEQTKFPRKYPEAQTRARARRGVPVLKDPRFCQQDQIGLLERIVANPATLCAGGEGSSDWKNQFGYPSPITGLPYDGACSFFGGAAPLPLGIGWFLILGVGAGFALITSAMLYLSNLKQSAEEREWNNSEHFSTAGRSIPAFLTAADVVSKWTWAATLLQSSNVAYTYGVSGPFWYASGATIQILLFAILAIEIKLKCPAIHTMLEVVLARWGSTAHMVFLFFGLLTNLIVTSMLILGGAGTVQALTDVPWAASSFLIPLGVVGYTAFGGLHGTYYASWTHTTIIYIALLIFIWTVYAASPELGSTAKVFENLNIASVKNPVDGNDGNGSYLTMASGGGLMFGLMNIVGNFGTVFVDQSYWQGAIACRPNATYKGYLLGGMSWFAIPFSMATTLGLAGRALDLPITSTEAGGGLVPPAVATHLMGAGGSFLVALQLFLAVTSTANSEQLAVSSLFCYDVYKRYINPEATGSQLIFVSRCGIVFWGIISGVASIVLNALGISLGWMYMAMGILIGSAVAPIMFALLWKDCTPNGAIGGAVGGLFCAVISWVVSAATIENPEGIVSVATLGGNWPLLIGNLFALISSPVLAYVISAAGGFQNYDWKQMKKTTGAYLVEADRMARLNAHGEESIEQMTVQLRRTWILGGVLTIVLIVIWPLLSLPANPFTESYFTFWVALAFIWAHFAAVTTIIGPILEYLEVRPFYTPAPEYEPSVKTDAGMGEVPAGFYMPGQMMPMQMMPMQTMPMQTMPMQMQTMPMQTMPMQMMPGQQMYGYPMASPQ